MPHVLHKLPLLLALSIPVCWAGAAAGQALPIPVAPSRVGPSPAPPTPAPAAAAAAISPAQAEQVLGLLRDDKRRAEFAATLETIVKAAPAASLPATAPLATTPPATTTSATAPPATAEGAAVPPAEPAAAKPAEPAAAKVIPLEPDSLAAQIVDRASASLSDAGSQLTAAVESMNDLPLLWRWVETQAADPVTRARLLDTAGKLALAIAAGLLVQWGTARVLRRLRATLEAWAPGNPDRGNADPGNADRDVADLLPANAGMAGQREAGQRFSQTIGTLSRLPYLLGRLLLDLVPVAAFAACVGLLLGTRIGQPATTGLVIRAVLNAVVLCQSILRIMAFLVAPGPYRLRLLHVSDWAAAFLSRWTRRIAVTAIATYTVTEIAVMFGMYATAHDALLKLFMLVVHILLVVAILQARAPVAALIRPAPGTDGVWAVLRTRLADSWHLLAAFPVVALWVVWAVELRDGYTRLIQFFLVTCAVVIGARLLGVVLLGGLERAMRPSAALAARHPGLGARAGFYFPVLRLVVVSMLWAAAVIALLQAWGFGPLSWFSQGDLGSRILSAAVLTGVTVLIAILVWEGANAGLERHLSQLSEAGQLARSGRLRTLMPMLRTSLLVTIVIVVGLIVLSEIGVNIAPLLAGAGVVGIAVGFGSQKLVQDLITGLFLLLENAMQVGDVVTLGGLSGTVEALSIRTIRLRALDGAVHIIPFSAVTTVTNQTRDYGYALLDISVGLNEEPGPVIDVVRDLAAEMRSDPKWASLILEALDVMGVDRFVDLAWVLRVRLKTQPASRWSVARELNRRVKERFDKLGIDSPLTSHRALSSIPAPVAEPVGEPEPVKAGEAVKAGEPVKAGAPLKERVG